MDEKQNEIPMVKQIDAEKIAMYQNFANKRLLIALIFVIVGFIIYASVFVIGYTVREQNWQETSIKLVERFTQGESANEILTHTDH